MLDIVNKKNLFGDTSPHGDEISDLILLSVVKLTVGGQ